jgi:L-2-hydroxyglutarate oxidase LhgO
MMEERVDCTVIGAGVIGLAVARALAMCEREVLVLEETGAIGSVTSSRNSEVIHAGLYYPLNSLKARLCRRGRDLLYRYLKDRGIAHLRCGKLIVAGDESEVAALAQLAQRAEANGVDDLVWLGSDEARQLEPELYCVAALHSPSTGIFDSHAYMLSLRGDAEAAGAMFAFFTPFIRGHVDDDGFILEVGGAAPMQIKTRSLVNCAGLGAQHVAATLSGYPPSRIPPLYYAKGNYFALRGKAPFARLVYPLPDQASIGLHYTRDLAGQGRFGPDVEWVDGIDYAVDGGRAERFIASIRRYWPALPENALTPAYAGIRPKVQAPGEAPRDFIIEGPDAHGIPGLVQMYGIESPGLTASLAIAEHVAACLGLNAAA